MTTALDQINGACKLLGVLAAGETLPAEDSQDALDFLNQMLDSWSTEDLLIYASTTQSLTWSANNATQTLGPTGDIVGLRPLSLGAATYYTDPTTNDSYNVTFISEEEYNSISLKTVTSTYPEYIQVDYSVPNVTMSVYPIPTKDLTWNFVSATVLPQPATLATVLVFPPGYMRAFKYNLAVELSPIFGITPSPYVDRTATGTKRVLKRNNRRIEDARISLPCDLPSLQTGQNIFSGV